MPSLRSTAKALRARNLFEPSKDLVAPPAVVSASVELALVHSNGVRGILGREGKRLAPGIVLTLGAAAVCVICL